MRWASKSVNLTIIIINRKYITLFLGLCNRSLVTFMTQRMSNGSVVMNNEVASIRNGIALVWFTILQNLPEEVLKTSENIKKIGPNPRYEYRTRLLAPASSVLFALYLFLYFLRSLLSFTCGSVSTQPLKKLRVAMELYDPRNFHFCFHTKWWLSFGSR